MIHALKCPVSLLLHASCKFRATTIMFCFFCNTAYLLRFKVPYILVLWHHSFFPALSSAKWLNLTSDPIKTKVALYLHPALLYFEAIATDRAWLCFIAALFWRQMWFAVDNSQPATITDGSWDNKFSVEQTGSYGVRMRKMKGGEGMTALCFDW